jgi:uncharacterized membrane protein
MPPLTTPTYSRHPHLDAPSTWTCGHERYGRASYPSFTADFRSTLHTRLGRLMALALCLTVPTWQICTVYLTQLLLADACTFRKMHAPLGRCMLLLAVLYSLPHAPVGRCMVLLEDACSFWQFSTVYLTLLLADAWSFWKMHAPFGRSRQSTTSRSFRQIYRLYLPQLAFQLISFETHS